ncbi:MAG: hypothetical protein M1812_001393 [Candelaria pacifica]|nr:MAG: hypothetical protein M1812_001393 [Candelaria pacifica]
MPLSSGDDNKSDSIGPGDWYFLSAKEKAEYFFNKKSNSPAPGIWSTLSAKEKAEYYYKSKDTDYGASDMSSSSGDRREADSRDMHSYMRPYAYAESKLTDGEERQHRQALHPEEDNPFIAFRRYADSQVSSLLQSMIGLPSMFSSPAQRFKWQEVEEARQRAKEMRKWGGVEDAEDLGQSKSSETKNSREQWKTSNLGKIRYPYRSADESENQESGSGGEGVENHYPVEPLEVQSTIPTLDKVLNDSTSSLNELSYLIFSPYSPLHLADDPRFKGNIDKWMNAYQDLMCVENQEEMRSIEDYERRNYEYPSSCTTAGSVHLEPDQGYLDWCKNIATVHPSLIAMVHEQRDAETELDLHESFLESQCSSKASEALESSSNNTLEASSSQVVSSTSDKSTPQSIISTLTTTERRTLPDGTVHTKIVLRKRFADGEEESTETVLKTKGNQGDGQRDHSHLTKKVEAPAEAAKEIKGKKKGWFWSD